jgi:membrane-associated phospholipid phosphatase
MQTQTSAPACDAVPVPGVRRPRLLGEVGIVLVLLVVYDRVAAELAGHAPTGDAHGQDVLGLEARLHLDREHSLNAWLSAHHLPELLATSYYQVMYTTTALAVLVACYARRPDLYRRARNALIGINVVGLIAFVAYPVAPPRSLPDQDFVDSTAAIWPVHYPPDHFGAMPSLHLSWAVWVTAVGVRLTARPVLRLFLAVHPVLTAIAVVSTANHYTLDVLAGAALGVAACGATFADRAALDSAVRWGPRTSLSP